jgi:hypothetical protein
MDPRLKLTIVLVLAMSLLWAAGANAQFLTVLNTNVPAGFGQAGFIQSATLGSDGGGTLTMNGINMIVPANSVVQFPANTFQWADVFLPKNYTPIYDTTGVPTEPNLSITCTAPQLKCTGLALLDNPAQSAGQSPYLPFNANVLGNIDTKNVTGKGLDSYIVGLILPINQDLGNGGAGIITFIDYAKGRFEVGGQLNTPGTGTVIEINDPSGRYGWAHSPDPRWSVDPDNPTITAGDGYPMCIPKHDPAVKLDPDCPIFNRPLNPSGAGQDAFLQPGAPLMVINMPPSVKAGTTKPDPWKEAPFMIGDYVAYSGVMYKNDPIAPLDPTKPLNQQTYISANTVGADKVAIYTAPCPPGTQDCTGTVGPAYMQLARMVIGTGGATPGTNVLANANLGIIGGQIPLPEARNNIVVVGFVTDSTQLVDIFAADIGATSGIETDRKLGTVLPEPGAGGRGNKGRFRFDIGKGSFGNRTRVYLAQTHHGMVQVPNQHGTIHPKQGGLISGQYHAPMFTFQFADAPPGFPIIPQNFDSMPFLTQGEGGNPSDGPLVPFPPFCPLAGSPALPTCQP